ncbi:MAG: T9SS type A sorting domain-containing protein, partial [Bacteroidota bacterium]
DETNFSFTNINIFDSKGKNLNINYTSNTTRCEINIESLEEGLYLIEIKSNNNLIQRRFFVVQKK